MSSAGLYPEMEKSLSITHKQIDWNKRFVAKLKVSGYFLGNSLSKHLQHRITRMNHTQATFNVLKSKIT